MNLADITPLVLTYNEQENIERTLDALAWATQILLIDSFSTDDTIARATKIRPEITILQRRFDSHAAQWNFGLENIKTPWVLALDADYVLSSQLEQEIRGINAATEIAGFEADFVYRICGEPLRASLYPPHVVLFQKDRARYVDEGHTQVLRVDGATRRLRGVIYHDDRKPLSRWIRSQDVYSVIEARHLLGTPSAELSAQDRLRKKIFFAPAAIVLYLLFGKALIFDGWRGWYYVAQRAIAELLLSIRLLTERHHLER